MTPRVRAAAMVLVLAAATLAVPLAAADHVYSHRYVVWGRVVDADGAPVVGLPVPVGTTGFRKGGHCAGTSPASGVTDTNGTFYYCLHVHHVDADDVVRVRVAGDEHVAPADPHLRVTSFLVTTTNVTGEPRDVNATRPFVVTGRAWQGTEEGLLDGVHVAGVALGGLNVSVTLLGDGNATVDRQNATTTDFGDYAAYFDVPPNVNATRVLVHARNDSFEFLADPVFLVTRADIVWSGNASHPDVEAPERRGPPPEPVEDVDVPVIPLSRDAPGDTPPFVGSGAFWFTLLGVAAVAALAVAVATRKQDRGPPPSP